MDVESMKSIINDHMALVYEIALEFREKMKQLDFNELRVIQQNLKNLILESEKQLEDINMELSADEIAFINSKKAKLLKIVDEHKNYCAIHSKLIDTVCVFLSSVLKLNVAFLEFKTNFTE